MKKERSFPRSPTWISRVMEFTPPLRMRQPVWIRRGVVRSGPVVPTPEFHHCCEFSIILQGSVIVTVEGEERKREPGDVLLIPPGLPHDHRILKYPVSFITVFFLPSLLLEMVSEQDGLTLLNRFSAHQPIKSRLIHLPHALRREMLRRFSEMAEESRKNEFGRGIRLCALLMDLLVRFQRWEKKARRFSSPSSPRENWGRTHRALAYLREHFSEAIYARDLARVTGISESRLRALFHNAIGMTWGRYLEIFRCEQAAAILLCQSPMRVSETAFAVGFQSLSSFNTSFRRVMGCSPTACRHRAKNTASTNQ